jgi:hypothetical protein
MSKKDELRGGLQALFGDRKPIDEAKPVTMEQEPTTEQDEQELINTIEDEALRAALHKKRMDGRGRPRKNTDERGNRTDGYRRTTLIVSEEQLAKIKEIGFKETLTMKEIIEKALDMVIERYEAKNGEIKPQPSKYKGDIKKVFED